MRTPISGQFAYSVFTFIVNTRATHLDSSLSAPAFNRDAETNSYHLHSTPTSPATPPSSMLSRAAASAAVSSSSHPPFGKIKSLPSTLAPFRELSMSTSTRVGGAAAAAASRDGLVPESSVVVVVASASLTSLTLR